MKTQITKRLDFSGKKICVGLDVHKKSWSVTIIVVDLQHFFGQIIKPHL